MSTESARLAQSPTSASFHPYPFSGTPILPAAKRYARHHAVLAAVDALLVVGTTYLAYQASPSLNQTAQWISLLVVFGVWMALLKFNRFYDVTLKRPAHQLAYEMVKISGLGILIGSALFYLAPSISVPREVHWNASLLAGLSLLLWRLAYLQILPSPKVKKRAIFVGPTTIGIQIAEEIQQNPESGYEVVGFIESQNTSGKYSTHFFLGEDNNLPQIVLDYQVNSIILPVAENIPDSSLKAIADCSELGCEFVSTSRLYEQISGRIPVQHITNSWFVSELNVSDRLAYQMGKRLMDIGLSLVGLLATGLLVPVLSLAIKLDSPGPIFYSQIRAGKNGRPFRIYKFRSMVHGAEKQGAVWAKVNDSRVTRLGTFLRKTRLDELPQLYNVLLGDMSLVGPRPERPEFIERLSQEIPFFNKRQLVVPGLTGWAQVNYPYGASTADALEKLQYDLYYIKNRSMFLDLEILLRTILVVIKKQGAR